jgi:sulfonate transport system permease protein
MEGFGVKFITTGRLPKILFPIFIIVIWQLLAKAAANPFFPTPLKILSEAQYVYTSDWVKNSLALSIFTLLAGFSIGSFSGIFFGSIIGSVTFARIIFTPITNFMRSIPSVAKIPVIMALFGLGVTTRITTVALAVFFPVLMTTMRAIEGTNQKMLEYSKLLNFGYMRSLLLVRIPAATGEILTSLQAAIQIAVLVMVVSEMLGSGRGLGAFIIRAQSTYMITDMWVGIVTLGIIGVALNEIFHLIERRVAPWYFSSKGLM